MSETAHDPTLNWDMADRLRKALRFADVSVSEMADDLGVSRNTVGRYINGHVTPDYRTLRLWALRTGAPLDWLMGSDADSANITRIWRDQPTREEILAHAKPLPAAAAIELRRSLGQAPRPLNRKRSVAR